MREAVTKGCKQRCAYLVTKPLIYALDGYLSFRIEHDIGMDLSGEQKDYKACDSLQSHITLLYKRAGLKESSSHSGRRTFAGKVLASTADMDAVAQLLGHSSIDCSQRYVDLDPRILEAMFADAFE